MGKGSVGAVGIWLGVLLPGTLQAQTPVQARFITVEQGQDELAADRALAEQLGASLVHRPEQEDYKVVIDDLVADSRPEGTVARVTPYAFVVAEMLGAKMEVVATFRSRASGTTTYGAYLVVRRSEFPSQGSESGPTLTQVMEHLQSRSHAGSPARFVYHSRFSTSSYFFPSLYFRGQRVFAQLGADDAEKGISTIRVEQLPGNASGLVTAVAEGTADLASVWDGARAKFAQVNNPPFSVTASKVWFVRLPDDLPNDLLVATRSARAVSEKVRDKLVALDGKSSYPTGSDVQGWHVWSDDDVEEARMALSELRHKAAPSALNVVVDVHPAVTAPASADEVEAVRQSLRLAGTELVAKSEYADDEKSDIVWELARIHDGALRLTIRYPHFSDSTGKEVTQQFEISFDTKTPADLTRRVSVLINSRMHRIRPVWLYCDTAPTVIRDVAFDAPERALLPLQQILWKDPRRNDYTVAGSGYKVVQLEKSDFSKLELNRAAFPERGDKTLAFEPMGRQAFRVLLLRPTRERPLFQALTVAFVVLFALAAIGLVWDARKDWARSSAAAGPERKGSSASLVPDAHTAAFTGGA